MFTKFIRGITDHLRLRYPSWIMSTILLGVGLVLLNNPNIFTNDTKAYQYVFADRTFDQRTWGVLCVVLSTARLAALVVNGTFKVFPWSNHIRGLGAALSCFIWLQIAFGVWVEGMRDGWNTATPIYFGLLVFDMANAFSAVEDIRRGK